MLRLYLITPPEGDPTDAVRAALEVLPRGSAGVQLRQQLPARELLERARAIREICTNFAAPFLVNDRADVALAAGADGVHLPARGLKPKDARALGLQAVGESVHSAEEAARSEADFVVFAPVFDTPGKTAQGVEKLAEACRATRLPVFALGGVDASNAARCIDAGARGVACIRSVLGAKDPAAAAIALWKAIVLAVVLGAGAARADDSRYQDFPVGSRATALGGAFVALSDDPSGLYYNPAGICDARKLNVNVSASLYGFERQSRGAITIDRGTFSIAGLNELNVIPGEAGLLKGVGALDDRGTPFAYGFDVTVPQFRSYGVDATDPFIVHDRVIDRTFTVAAGGGMRFNDKLNVGFAVHYVLRLYETSEDALSKTGPSSEPTVGAYHASASFENGNVVGVVGAKYHYSEEWVFGTSLGLPGVPLHSGGSVSVQDVISDPTAPAGSRSQANLYNTTDVNSRTFVPALLRVGAAHIKPHRWTISGQITGHLGTSYDRFSVDPSIEQRLRVQDHVEREAVIDVNFGGEYLLNPEYSLAAGFFTSRSGAPEFRLAPDGTLLPGSSREPRVSLYGATATLGLIGQHSISRLGMSVAYGTGDDAVPNDPTGIIDPGGFRPAEVKQLFLYFFLASTFRY
ncbi:MAG: thiamine phosphate synthase [Myxococcales bacterium]|nr:thiamine phosphate synthase [Myxococcales bacterium]